MRGLRSQYEIENLKEKKITIKLISGFQIPKKHGDKDIVDPFITVEFYTTSMKERIKNQDKFTSKIINDNGFNPIWNEIVQYFFV